MRTATFSKTADSAGGILIEILIATTIGITVLGSIFALIAAVAREQRSQLACAYVEQEANLLEDKITRLIRSMSATETVALSDLVSGSSTFYRQVTMARAATPAPRERLAYTANNTTCTYIPNIASGSGYATLNAPTASAVLRNMYFYISEKMDGTPDGSAVTVFFQMDDNGMGQRGKTNKITRCFTATMRNI